MAQNLSFYLQKVMPQQTKECAPNLCLERTLFRWCRVTYSLIPNRSLDAKLIWIEPLETSEVWI